MKRILAPTAGEAPAKEMAAYIVGIAKMLDAELIALHVLAEDASADAGDEAIRVFSSLGDELGVRVSGALGHGNVVAQIADYANENAIDLVVMGASRGKVVSDWISADVMERTNPPVVVVPHELRPG